MTINNLEQLETELKRVEKEYKEAEWEEKFEQTLREYHGEDEIISFQKYKEISEAEVKTDFSLKTSIPTLDRIIEGFQGGELVIITGPTGQGKCLGKGTPILMYDGTIKKVENVKVGDKLMGDNSEPRKVLSLARGKEEMYKVIPVKGDIYTANKSHILSLKRTNDETKKVGKVIDISIEDYLKQSKTFKHIHKGFRVLVKFKKQKLSIPPYILGIWLGDGTSANSAVETADKEIVNKLQKYADDNNWKLSKLEQKESKSDRYSVVQKKKNRYGNSFQKLLRELNLLGNKHIPLNYKVNDRKNRLELLAGLIDSDGYYNVPNGNVFVNKNKKLAEDVVFLAKSLGFAAYIHSFINKQYQRKYWKVGISGDLSIIPVLLKRKKCEKRKQKKDVLMTGIKVEPIGIRDYYGFKINGNGRFLLGDFTVTHNTTLCQTLTKNFSDEEIKSLWFSYEVSIKQFLAKFGDSLPSGYLPKSLISRQSIWIERKIVEAIVKYQTKAVFIDHLHYLLDLSKIRNTSLEIGGIVRELKSMAVKYNIVIFLVAHMTKTGYEDRIGLEDIRDSSFISQEADYVIVLWRDKEEQSKIQTRKDGVKFTNKAIVSVEKNRRTGKTGTLTLVLRDNLFYEETTNYEENFN